MSIFRFVIIIFIIFTFFTCYGIKKSETPHVIPLIVQGDLAVKENVEDILRSQPYIMHPETGIKYSIQIVEPDPSIDYYILQVEPDARYDYHMHIIDPITNQVTSKLDSKLTYTILESIKKHNQTLEKKP